MLGYSIANFISKFQIESPLWGQKLIPLLDYTFSNNYVDKAELSEPFYQIVNKYINTNQLPLQSLKYYVEEMGYGYILDFFQPDEKGAQKLVSFLVLIHFLKGSRKGLELALSIMGVSATIKEWYESYPLREVNSFILEIDPDTLVNNNDPDTYRNFEKFLRSYVYPEVNFVVSYKMKIVEKTYSDLQGTMIVRYPGKIDAKDVLNPISRVIEINLIQEIINSMLVYSDIDSVLDMDSLLDLDSLNYGNTWTLTDCYLDYYNRIIPNSTQTWENINSQTWSNIGLFYGVNGAWGEPCVTLATIESTIVDTGSSLNTLIGLLYNTIVRDSSNVIVKWRTSNDNITWSDYTQFTQSAKTLRYYQFKIFINCPTNQLAIIY